MVSGSGSQKFWRPLPGCSASYPSAASSSGSQRLGRPLPGCCAPFPSGERLRQPEACEYSPRVRRTFSLRGERPRQPEVCVASPWLWRTFSLCSPSARHWSGLRKSLDRNRGPVCSVGGGGFSGAEFAPFPSPLPPTSSGDGPAPLCSFSENRRRCVPAG